MTTQEILNSKWNRKIYNGYVYVNNIKVAINAETEIELKKSTRIEKMLEVLKKNGAEKYIVFDCSGSVNAYGAAFVKMIDGIHLMPVVEKKDGEFIISYGQTEDLEDMINYAKQENHSILIEKGILYSNINKE